MLSMYSVIYFRGESVDFNVLLKSYSILFSTMIIVELTGFRENFRRILSEIIEDINTFYQLEYDRSKLHKIYSRIIGNINSKKLLIRLGLEIENITCFIYRKNNFVLFNSSRFIYTYEIDEIKTLKNHDEQKIYFGKIQFSYNKNEKKLAYVISPEKNTDNRFVYLIELKKPIILPLVDEILFRYLNSVFSYLNKLYSLHFDRRSSESEFHLENRNKLEYILRAINAMHFVRNRLSPIKTFINVSKLTENEVDKAKKTKYNKDRLKLIGKADNELREIVKRADYLLEKSRNPFIIDSTDRLSVRSLHGLIREIWIKYFDTVSINIFNEGQDSILYKEIEYSYDHLASVITDLINNISKYNKGQKGVFISQVDEMVIVNFYNNFDTKETHALSLLAKSYNTENNWEINKRKTFGLFFIKNTLNQMKIESRLEIEDDLFFTQLKFKTIQIVKKIESNNTEESTEYISKNVERLSAKSLYGLVREMWMSYFNDNKIDIEQGQMETSILNYDIAFSYDDMRLVVDEILSNISRNQRSNYKVIFRLEKQSKIIQVSFINDYQPNEYSYISELVNEYNSGEYFTKENKVEHGLSKVNRRLNQMDIVSNLEIDESNFYVNLDFKIIE